MTYVPQDVLDRLAALEREVRQLRGRAQMRPALNQVLAGDVVIGEGGQLIVRPPEAGGSATFAVGHWADGTYGTVARRNDGSRALQIEGEPGNDAGMIRTFNRAGSVIMMDDGWADDYLGRPWVPVPVTPYVDFTSADDLAAYSGLLLVQHKVLHVSLELSAPSGTSASMYLNVGGQQLGPTWTLSSSATSREVSERLPLSANSRPHGSFWTVALWVRRTGGTGTCTVRVRGVWGVNTINAGEAD